MKIDEKTKMIAQRLFGIEMCLDSLFLLALYHFDYRVGFWIFLGLIIINDLTAANKIVKGVN